MTTHLNPLQQKRWSPYVVGAGIGMLSWLTFGWMDASLGTSTSLVHGAAVILDLVAPAQVTGPTPNAVIGAELAKNPLIDWQFALVIGVAIGAWASSRLSGDTVTECVPSLWQWRFGGSKAVRYTAAFASGAVMAFGARMAGGCTSGHGISGGLQLAVSSWIFFLATFAAGVATALVLFGWEGRRHVHDV